MARKKDDFMCTMGASTHLDKEQDPGWDKCHVDLNSHVAVNKDEYDTLTQCCCLVVCQCMYRIPTTKLFCTRFKGCPGLSSHHTCLTQPDEGFRLPCAHPTAPLTLCRIFLVQRLLTLQVGITQNLRLLTLLQHNLLEDDEHLYLLDLVLDAAPTKK